MYKRPLSEPIAIVGSSCRFAGDATSPSRLWDVLSKAPDLSREVPSNRFNAKGFYHVDGEHHGTTNSINAYWLNQDHRVFDAGFFNITPKEAEAIDPQQRLLLEVVFEAMESAGYSMDQYSGKQVAVFSGVMTADYDTLSQRDELSTSQYYATGNARSIISNRISYFFNFHGPSMTIDTACSSSLVALHQAVQSLRNAESTMACVTGVNVMLTPEQFIVESSLHMLSPTGKSRMWDAEADGYARGEGVAAVLLKPLSRALMDGDQIEAIIRETGVNSDGRTNGVTMPNPVAQANLIRSTYLNSGLDPQKHEDQCQYFEAHGTGTPAGDPREASAIDEAFFGTNKNEAEGRMNVPNKMLVGSVKTVIGHTEGAAGLAGLLKVIQAMKHGSVPPNLHMKSLNPKVKPYCTYLEVPTSSVPWPEPSVGQPKRASVNSFGFGGANAHAIIESYEPNLHHELTHLENLMQDNSLRSVPEGIGQTSVFLPLLLSATSQKSLRAVVLSYKDYLTQHPNVQFDELARVLFSRRSALRYRVALSAHSALTALEALDGILDKSASTKDIGIRSSTMTERLQILGIFTGQGSQWPTMSRSLLQTNKVYRETIRNLDEVLRSCPNPPSWTLEDQIMADKDVSRINEAAISQPLCTAIQIGLVDLLRSLNVDFHTVIGHSSGEIAAAYAVGRLSARDAVLIAYYRGFVKSFAGGPGGEEGGMLAAGFSETEGLAFCRDPMFQGRLALAASNSPYSVTISGDLDMIKLANEELKKQDKFSRLLQVDAAYHSPHMTKPAAEYIKVLQNCGISPEAEGNGIVWVSSVYGYARAGEKDLDAGYWRDNMVYTVQFHDAVVNALTEYGPYDCAVEVGPHSTLRGPFTQTAKSMGHDLSYVSLLDRSKDDSLAFSDFLGLMWSRYGPLGANLCNYIDQSPRPSVLGANPTALPSYPWDHAQIHYRESRLSRQFHARADAPHELLGVRSRDDNEHDLRWRNILKSDRLPWVEGHRFQGQALIPASAYCLMVLDAAQSLLNGKTASVVEIQNLRIMSGISPERETSSIETQFSLTVHPPRKGSNLDSTIEADFNLASCPADETTPMTKNMEGSLRIYLAEPTLDALPARCAPQSEMLPASPEAFYKMMDDTGLVYSGPFRSLETIRRRYNYCSATLKRRHPEDTTTLQISPATLDSCFQSAFLSYAFPGDKSLWTTFLPTIIERVRFNLATQEPALQASKDDILTVDAHMTEEKPTTADSKATFVAEIGIFNQEGQMEVQVEGLTVVALAHTTPKDDHELYLHSIVDIDPMDEIVQANVESLKVMEPALVESCTRVATFFMGEVSDVHDAHERLSDADSSYGCPASPAVAILDNISPDHWSSDTREVIDQFILDSKYYTCLDFIRALGGSKNDLLSRALPLIIDYTHCLSRFSGHVGRIVQQIAHRYPRMDILSLVEPETGLLASVLSSAGSSFSSFTIGTGAAHNLDKHIQVSDAVKKKIVSASLDLTGDFKAQLGNAAPYDLVLLSTSQVENNKATNILENVRSIMRPGGYLVLVQLSDYPLKDRIQDTIDDQENGHVPSTPPEWPDILDASGFVQIAKNSNQIYHPGFSVTVRQLSSSVLVKNLSQPRSQAVTDHLLIVGGASTVGASMSQQLQLRANGVCHKVTTRTIHNLDAQTIRDCTAAIILADLDESLMSTMTEHSLDRVRELLRPNVPVLWTTRNARFGNPDHAATLGFARTISAEIPNLNLQVLDLEDGGDPVPTILETFIQLASVNGAGKDGEEALWTREAEIHIENGRRMIPRVVPLKRANDRINSIRRVVSSPVNTIQESTEVVLARNPEGPPRYVTRKADCNPRNVAAGKVVIQVDYSTVEAVKLSDDTAVYLCIGRNISTNESAVALSSINSSYVSLPPSHVATLPAPRAPRFDLSVIGIAARCIVAQTAISLAGDKGIVLIDPDLALAKFLTDIAIQTGRSVASYTTVRARAEGDSPLLFLHPHVSSREIKAIFPAGGAHVFNFQREDTSLSQDILEVLPRNCQYHSACSLFGPGDQATNQDLSPLVQDRLRIVASVMQEAPRWHHELHRLTLSAISLPDLQAGRDNTSSFQIIDWRTDRNVLQLTRSINTIGSSLFRADRTYVLVGLTGDFGQSLCSLFTAHGARHIVLASRNPKMAPNWVTEMARATGSTIQIRKLDVTKTDDVRAFPAALRAAGLPPVAGIANGSMVLRDRVFAQMDEETWHAVLGPKTVGSANLDAAFADADLDFFIMTSSFAAIGGHAGQTNYAAANAYMNGLAARRRRRQGRAGSVLNIGVVYGLGFLARERGDLYAGLEREGYPPISERDLHAMFLEAIVAGRPDPDGRLPYDITTGLRRFDPGAPNPMHWHLDPRFSHFTLEPGDDDVKAGDGGAAKQSLKEVLEGLAEEEAIAQAIWAQFRDRLQAVLQLPDGGVNADQGIPELGVDSLIAVEIRNWIWKVVGCDISVLRILGARSVYRLCQELAKEILEARSKDAGAPAATAGTS
ncbi:ketoacyl-synt-domain-containing protein [Whalleya microplaca]|nr:ketoacyl-synt-domain-containing protein [Whalleya microplaca]